MVKNHTALNGGCCREYSQDEKTEQNKTRRKAVPTVSCETSLLGMLSQPWRLSRLGSQFETGGGQHSLARCSLLNPIEMSPFSYVLAGVRVAHGIKASRNLQARLSKPSLLMMLGFLAQGSFLTVQRCSIDTMLKKGK